MTGSAKASSRHRTQVESEDGDRQEGCLTSYCEVVNYLLTIYATDDVITEAEADILNFKQTQSMTAMCYSQQLWEKALRCGKVYHEGQY